MELPHVCTLLEIMVKPGKKQDFFKMLKEKILPILNKYEIIDLITAGAETEAAKVMVISFSGYASFS
jgi:hypothetical protein